MAERRATNKYYPPDWDPSKVPPLSYPQNLHIRIKPNLCSTAPCPTYQGSINTFVGQHPLRDRARKLDQGILVIRFEMPFSIWCLGCEKHIGKGVRYNAEKKKVGMYYSTPIWQFRMKCHLCSSWMEIHTDPKNAVYVIISGARKREEEYDPEDNETLALKDKEEAEKLLNPMYKLENTNKDVLKAKEAGSAVSELMEYNNRMWKDPFSASQKIRSKFRAEKKIREAEAQDSAAVRDKHNLLLHVLAPTKEDEIISKTIEYGVKQTEQSSKNQLRNAVLSKSIFTSGASSASSSIPTKSSSSRKNPTQVNSKSAVASASGLVDKLSTSKRIHMDPFANTSFIEESGAEQKRKRVSNDVELGVVKVSKTETRNAKESVSMLVGVEGYGSESE
ncbi:hypothetical protein HDU81_007415 [Chytriomyces hyalinus]|nr:hypothetical protein HDU81_007415 [Chytriomyces hyalinus]